jgi:hypothetical protein
MGELCHVVKFGQKCTKNRENGAGKMKNNNRKKVVIEKKASKIKGIITAKNIEILYIIVKQYI